MPITSRSTMTFTASWLLVAGGRRQACDHHAPRSAHAAAHRAGEPVAAQRCGRFRARVLRGADVDCRSEQQRASQHPSSGPIAHRDPALRQLALHAVGEAGAQLRGSRSHPAQSQAGRPLQRPSLQSECNRISSRSRSPPRLSRSGRRSDFVRSSKLRGGTDLLKALTAALAQSTQPNTSLALFSDGGSDRGETVIGSKIAARYAAQWKQSAHPPQTDVFAVGDDANLPLLRKLAQNKGFLEPVLSTEPVDFHLQSWTSKLTRRSDCGSGADCIEGAHRVCLPA
jgi:hypothetical protein